MASLNSTTVALVSACRSTEGAEQWIHRKLLDTVCRYAPTGPVNVSKAAQAEADRRGLGDLRSYGWHDQRTKMRDPERVTFAWEHFWPVRELRVALEALENPTERRVRAILRRASIAWILKVEDRELTRLRFGSRRPDPPAAYRKAGIELLHDWPW